jgi:hypothetical protein
LSHSKIEDVLGSLGSCCPEQAGGGFETDAIIKHT